MVEQPRILISMLEMNSPLSSGGIDSDNDIFITATADDVNLAAGLTADNEVTIISTSGSVLQTAGNILATDDVNIDAAASSQKIDLAGTIGSNHRNRW